MSTPYEQAVEAEANAPRYWCPDCEGTLAVLDTDASRAEGVAMYKGCDRCVEGLVRAALPHLLAPIEALAGVLDAEARAAESMPCTGMNCGGCARGQDASRVRAALASIKGQPS